MRYRILIVADYLPYPLNHGGAIAQYYFLEKLQDDVSFTLCLCLRNRKDVSNLAKLKQQLPGINILSVKKYGARHFLIHRLFNGLGRRLRKQTASEQYLMDGELSDLVTRELNTNKYQFVQVEFFECLPIINHIPDNIKTVYVAHELRFRTLSTSTTPVLEGADLASMRLQETSLINKFDRVVVFTEEDKAHLQTDLNRVFVSPFGLPTALKTSQAWTGLEKLLFLGSEGHTANLDGLIEFLEHTYIPFYDEMMLPIEILGDWSADIKASYANYPKVIFKGMVENVADHMQNCMLVAHILTGTGIRTKVLQALQNRIPVIGTRQAFEGILNYANAPVLIYDSPQAFFKLLADIKSGTINLNLISESSGAFYQLNFNDRNLIERRKLVYDHA